MKLFGALVCAATLLCVSASPLIAIDDNDNEASGQPQTRAAECKFDIKCDTTGEEKVPIPCEGFCNKYFFCKNGNPVMETCPRFIGFPQNFNNITRQCEVRFNDCDWWKPDRPGPSTTSPDPSNPTGTTDPSNPTGSTAPDGSTGTGATGTTEGTTEGPCHHNADCDATGTQKKPIPCAGFCNRYYLCVEGAPTVKTCDTFQNFNNVTRECSISFKDCNWYKGLEPSSSTETPTTASASSTTPKATTVKPATTTPKGSGASSLVYTTASLVLAVLMPLARYL